MPPSGYLRFLQCVSYMYLCSISLSVTATPFAEDYGEDEGEGGEETTSQPADVEDRKVDDKKKKKKKKKK